MGRTIFVKEIITAAAMPGVCPTCERDDRMEENIIREKRSGGRTSICSRCEALIVVTNHSLRRVELSPLAEGYTIAALKSS